MTEFFQDLVYTTGSREVATHKSLALRTVVKQITGSFGLLRILHGLGHYAFPETI